MGDRKFLAKSLSEETIQEHTDCLLRELENLQSIYLNDINVNWKLLRWACIYHDLGKMNTKFQEKVRKNLLSNHDIPHGVLSTMFVDTKQLLKEFNKMEVKLLMSSIYYHHDRNSLNQIDLHNVIKEMEELQSICQEFQYDKVVFPKKLQWKEEYISRFSEDSMKSWLCQFVILKGLLNRIDYAASAHIPVERENDFLERSLEEFMICMQEDAKKNKKELPQWNDLQMYMKNNQSSNVVVLAQTGMGKTEAGLWWIGNHKGFFTLPIRTAINAIYLRIKNDILNNNRIDERVGLLHSETKGKYLQLIDEVKREQKEELFHLSDYYTRTKQLSLPLTVCTIDQLFPFVFRYRGYEAKLATLSYSKIVIDEIQMYGPDLVGFLIVGLKMIQELGGKFAVLTATFPGFLKRLMEENGLVFQMPSEPFVDKTNIRHSVQWCREPISSAFILKKYNNNRVLVICNTVKQCQKIYSELADGMGFDEEELKEKPTLERELNLFHAKFIYKDRIDKESGILEFGKLFHEDGRKNERSGIWITNSIAEASLDIDFDILITELSDVNGMFQRFGRCFRKRIWNDEGYNCFVFDGGDGECSGVGYNIDREIFSLSKKELGGYFSTKPSMLNEWEKMKLVEDIYSTEKVAGLQYYDAIKQFIHQPALFLPGETGVGDAQKMFRNIHSETIIPSSVYFDNEELILSLEKSLKDKDLSQEDKIRAREELKMFTLSIEEYQFLQAKTIRTIKPSKYDEIYVVEGNYDSEYGLTGLMKHEEETISSIF